MNMKDTIRYFIIAFFGVLAFSSCSLDEKSYMEMEQNSFIRDAKEAETVLLGVYRTMVEDPVYAYHLSMLFALPSDIAKGEGSTTNAFRSITANNYTNAQSEVDETWEALYSGIYRANDFMERLAYRYDSFSESDRRKAIVYMGEARTLRALFYFELVRWYGNVVLMESTKDVEKHPENFKESTRNEIYGFIEKDLKYAIDALPYANLDVVRSSNDFRMSKGAALGLLAKVYATWAGYYTDNDGSIVRDNDYLDKWRKSADVSRELIYSGQHGLLSDFSQLWENTNNGIWDPTESLIEVSFYSYRTFSSTSSAGRVGKWNGVTAPMGSIPAYQMAANYRVVPTFAQKWYNDSGKTDGVSNDQRFALSVADYRYTKASNGEPSYFTTTVGGVATPYTFVDALKSADAKQRGQFNNNLCPRKWDLQLWQTAQSIVSSDHFSNANWYVLRYADVLLLYAEALNELDGPTAEAYAAVNMVRRRGYGVDVGLKGSYDAPADMDQDTFREYVHQERAYELAFEGHRRQDLIRWGVYYESVRSTYENLGNWHELASDNYICGTFTQKGKHERLPIPLRETDMTSITQNPNWK